MKFSANRYMEITLEHAVSAAKQNEVPVAAIITDENNNIIAKAHNQTIVTSNPLKHAEIIALEQALDFLKYNNLPHNRLENCSMFVSLEPCAMCAGAIATARIRNLYYAASDEKGGGVQHGARVFSHNTCNHKPEIISGIMQEEASEILRNYFINLRKRKN